MRIHRSKQSRPAESAGLGFGTSIETHPRHLTVGDGFCVTFAITGYPAEVALGWLDPLLAFPGRLDICLHIDAVPPPVAADRLRRQRARLQASTASDADKGRLVDYTAHAAAGDAEQMAADLARGSEKLFGVGLYLTVHADDEESLAEEADRLRSLAASLLLDARPTTFRSLQGFLTTLPLGVDHLHMRRTMDTTALAASFPFASPDLDAPLGPTAILYGLNTASQSLVFHDRFAQPNYNAVVLGRSGSGKSYTGKLAVLRHLYAGVEVAVIDPEDEYTRLTEAVGGAHIPLGAPGVRLNPFDLPATGDVDTLTSRVLFGHTLISVLLGQTLSPDQRAVLDRCLLAAYQNVGVTSDPRTWNRPAPLLDDLDDALRTDGDPAAIELADLLAPYITGSWRILFDGPTTHRPDGHLVTFNLKHLPDELRAVGMLLVLDALWRRVINPTDRRPREVIVDEAWLLMRHGDGAQFLNRMAKSSRKHWAGLTVVTQDVEDMLASPLGHAIITNSATHLLLGQSPQAIEAVAAAFGLTAGERSLLLSAQPGEALLICPSGRTSLIGTASREEHLLITTDPAELATLPEEHT